MTNSRCASVGFSLATVCLLGLAACRAGDTAGPGDLGNDIRPNDRQIEIQDAIATRQYARAASLLDMIEADSGSAVYSFLRGRLAEATGFRADARQSYELSVRREPEFAGGWFQIALMDVGDKNYRAALRHFTTSLGIEESPPAWHGLGQAYFELGNVDSTLISLRRAIILDSAYVPARLSLARTYASIGEYSAAAEEARSVLAFAEDPGATVQLANALLALGKPAEAFGRVEPLIVSRPWDTQAQYAAARALRQLGRDDKATEALALFEQNTATDAAVFRLRERIRLTPSSIRDRLELADVYRGAGRTEEALGTLYPLMYLAGENSFIRNNIAVLHYSRGELPAARGLYEAILASDSTFVPSLLGLARLELSSNNDAAAGVLLIRALRHDPGNAAATRLLASLDLDP